MKHLHFMKTTGDGGWLDLAIHSKKDNVEQLLALRESLEEAYEVYRDLVLNPESELPECMFKAHKNLLIDYYECPPKRLSAALKVRRNDHNLNECPSCGYPFSPDTLDHFIPKDDWPEFSIMPNNLVPQCKYCAPKKSSRYCCETDGSAIFIHPIYFDLLSRIGFRVGVRMTGGKPEFEVEFVKVGEFDEAEIVRVKKHLSELEVKSRFRAYCMQEYSRWELKIKAVRFDIRVALNQRVSEKPNEGDFSRDWKTAFCKGVLSCDAVIEHLKQLTPQEQAIEEREIEELDL